MGFFSRRHRPSKSASAVVHEPVKQNYNQPQPDFNIYPAQTSYGQQYVIQQDLSNGSLSLEDYTAISAAIDQNTITDQFNDIITSIDEDSWQETDEDYTITITESAPWSHSIPEQTTRAIVPSSRARPPQKVTIWSKVSYYYNSTLHHDLPVLRVYIPTWPLICLAAQYSKNAYKSPQTPHERNAFVSADARLGTKAMVMKSVPCDDKKTLVFAIRGTSTLSLRDWNVNLHTEPVSPVGFLDDLGNLCHAGFLRVARAMIKPIAMRLRSLLEENPSRASCSLLITGHSAGGAVAALLFTHMLSSVRSELSILTDCFKRVHCVTFGAPPVSLLPLQKPHGRRYQKSLFFSFMNEGDPVVRAEKTYIRSLIDLLSSPIPSERVPVQKSSLMRLQNSISKLDLAMRQEPRQRMAMSQNNLASNFWSLPVATMSNAGRLVLMRVPSQKRKRDGVQRTSSNRWERDNLSRVTAHTITDEQLRNVIFGDPTVHAMEIYLRRVDMLALKAVTARE